RCLCFGLIPLIGGRTHSILRPRLSLESLWTSRLNHWLICLDWQRCDFGGLTAFIGDAGISSRGADAGLNSPERAGANQLLRLNAAANRAVMTASKAGGRAQPCTTRASGGAVIYSPAPRIRKRNSSVVLTSGNGRS